MSLHSSCAAAVKLQVAFQLCYDPAGQLQPSCMVAIQLCYHLVQLRPPHGAGTPPRARSPSVAPDAGEGRPARALCPPGTGKTRGAISKSRLKPKSSRYRREKQAGELPPPPLPPPGESPGPGAGPSRAGPSAGSRSARAAVSSATGRDSTGCGGTAEPQPCPSPADEVPPCSKAPCLPRGSCSTTGSVSSRGSGSSRGHGSGRSRTPAERGEGAGHGRRTGAPCPPREKR
ncbi:LOW QUALITY PROTEIN: uncharacterized protein RBU47_012700 [Passerculus sandwichensis]